MSHRFLYFLLVTSLFACEVDDNKSPSVSRVQINLQEGMPQVIVPGELRFDGLFADNDAVDSLRLVIVPLEELPSYPVARSLTSLDTLYNIGGQRSAITRFLPLPDDTWEGQYRLEVFFQDNSGNEGDSINLLFEVVNETPFIALYHPSEAFLQVRRGETLRIEGEVKHPFGYLNQVNVAFAQQDNRFFERIFQRSDTTLLQNSLSFNLEYTVDSVLLEGNYQVLITAADSSGLTTQLESPLQLVE